MSAVIEDLRAKGGVLEALSFTPSTHDLRHAFVTNMVPRMSGYAIDGVRLRPDDVKMITHTDEGRSSTASAAYDKNDYLDTKYAMLEAWEQWCLEGYNRVKCKMEKATLTVAFLYLLEY